MTKKLDMNLPLVLGVVTLLGIIVGAGASWQKHLDADDRLRERVRVLEQIAVSEHPDYSPMIYVQE